MLFWHAWYLLYKTRIIKNCKRGRYWAISMLTIKLDIFPFKVSLVIDFFRNITSLKWLLRTHQISRHWECWLISSIQRRCGLSERIHHIRCVIKSSQYVDDNKVPCRQLPCRQVLSNERIYLSENVNDITPSPIVCFWSKSGNPNTSNCDAGLCTFTMSNVTIHTFETTMMPPVSKEESYNSVHDVHFCQYIDIETKMIHLIFQATFPGF